MPKQRTIRRARFAQRAGKPASAQAGEFIREQMRRIGGAPRAARSPQQAVAIGLSEARRSGVALPPPRKRKAKKTARKRVTVVTEVGEQKRPPKRHPRPAPTVQRRKTKTAARRAAPKPAARRPAPPRPAAKRTAPKPAARRPAPKPAAKRPAPARKPAARRPAPRRPAPAPKRAARPVKFTARRAAAASRTVVTRFSGPSAAERAAARKVVEVRQSRKSSRTSCTRRK
jgi:hypothetical protein